MANDADTMWNAYLAIRIKYRAGAMSLHLYLLFVVHTANNLLALGHDNTALRLLGDVGSALIRAELAGFAALFPGAEEAVLELAKKLDAAGYANPTELIVSTASGGLPS